MLPIDKVCAGRPAQTIFFSARATLVNGHEGNEGAEKERLHDDTTSGRQRRRRRSDSWFRRRGTAHADRRTAADADSGSAQHPDCSTINRRMNSCGQQDRRTA